MRLFLRMVFVLFLGSGFCWPEEPLEFFVVIPSYNNNRSDGAGKNWVERCLESVFSQKNQNWTITYINDASTDRTGDVALAYATIRGMADKCTFINNEKNRGALANLYDAISACPPKKVVVLLDGDDELAYDGALDRVAKEYLRHDAWLTYGTYIHWPKGARGLCKGFSPSEIRHRRFRTLHFRTSHLRTFRAKLFQKINVEDLKINGAFCKGGWDLAIMFPMLEMASRGHVQYIQDVLYHWNCVNPISDDKLHNDEQKAAVAWARTKPKYPALRSLFGDEGSSPSQKFWSLMKKDASPCHQKRKTSKGWKLFERSYRRYLAKKNVQLQRGQVRIPHKIHFIWLGKPMPDFCRKMVESWKTFHPNWEVKVWADADVLSFKLKNQAAFDAASNWGEKADILRYEILLREGGLSAEAADFECLRPFDEIHAACDFFAGISYSNRSSVYNSLIGCSPNHPVIRRCVAAIKKGRKETGSTLLSKSLKAHLASHASKNELSVAFPTIFFYPFPEEARGAFSSIDLVKQRYACPEAFAVHYWASTWAPS